MPVSSFKLSHGRAEAGIAVLSFGGSSIYWLALAFAMSPVDYGRMMTLQAGVLVVVMIFTLRTHDLFFNLIARHGCSPHLAYRRTLKIELTAGAAGALVCAAGAVALDQFGDGLISAAGIAVFGFFASLGVIQGSSIGKLRYLTRGDVIARTDLLTALAWGAACASIPLFLDRGIVLPLIVGAVPSAVRSVSLLASVRRLLPQEAEPAADGPAGDVSKGWVSRYLAEAQVTNFLKNAAVPIETMILAAFAPATVVAMYRVARAVQGAANPALNVAYQRLYPILARLSRPDERRQAVRRLGRNSTFICLAVYPFSALISLGYSMLKPDVGLIELQLITAGTFLALLPLALQQGSFALLSIAGDHRSAGTAYLLSFCFLGLISLLLFAWPRMEIFMIGIVGGGYVRLWYLNVKSHKALNALPAFE